MPSVVTDTHALIWYLNANPRLSPLAAGYFNGCECDGSYIMVPAICVVEIVYLLEKGRIPATTLHSFLDDLNMGDTILKIADLDLAVALQLPKIPRNAVPDMPDRIIAATALSLQLPLISRDRKIQMSGLTTIW